MDEVYRPLRLHGQNLTYLIDDALFAASTREQALFRSRTLLLLLTALGFHLSWEKCELVPVQQGKFLGLIVDSQACRLSIPQDKVDRIKAAITTLLHKEKASSRELAGVAGMLMSASPALYMAPLYLRSLYHSMQPGEGWDTPVLDFDLTCDEYWLDNLDTCNGRLWLTRTNVVHVCGDASSIGYGAYTPHGELSYPMAMSFDDSEIQSMYTNSLSSVYRETKNARLAVQYAVQCLGSALAGGMVVYTGNCFPAIQCLVKMRGTLDVFPEVRELYLFAAEHDVHVDFAWMPRTAEWLQHADELSRLPDSSELFIRPAQLRLVCNLVYSGVSWGWPTLDVFAGAANGQHTASRFYSLHYAPGCMGINGLHQN